MPLLSTFGAASARSFGGIGAAAAGAGLDVDEVFSTFLYEGNGSTGQSIVNGIDLSNEGGLVWAKSRESSSSHSWYDTARGAQKPLFSNTTNAEGNDSSGGGTKGLYQFNNNGFTVGDDWAAAINLNNDDMVAWTFRKAPNFFDIVTYSGNDSNRTISHNLGSVPGMIIIKRLNNNNPWIIYHRSTGNTGFQSFDFNGFATVSNAFNNTSPTSSNFALGSRDDVNQSGGNYIAYLFAHNDGDGGFGPSGDQDIIKCGSFTPPSSGEVEVNLGFEPQFIITYDTTGGDNWRMYDVMRDWGLSNRQLLNPNVSAAESSLSNTGGYELKPTATGFIHEGHSASDKHIYMALRRGPLAEPENATKVFSIDTLGTSAPYFDSNHIVDMGLVKQTGAASSWFVYTRLVGEKNFYTDFTAAENNASEAGFDFMNGHIKSNWGGTNSYSWMWKRAPGYFDVVAYSGNYTARTINHNLGAAPEMIWVKSRTNTRPWIVYHSATGNDRFTILNATDAKSSSGETVWNQTTPTSSVFSIGAQNAVNENSQDFIAYLFATVAGISKVGSYTGTGAGNNQNIDCGFSSGARFVFIKRTDTTGSWYVFDSARGINAGAVDPYLQLNTTDAQASNFSIEPLSSGFTIVQDGPTELNISGSTYIFYAIA
jgi:hypothetical protein